MYIAVQSCDIDFKIPPFFHIWKYQTHVWFYLLQAKRKKSGFIHYSFVMQNVVVYNFLIPLFSFFSDWEELWALKGHLCSSTVPRNQNVQLAQIFKTLSICKSYAMLSNYQQTNLFSTIFTGYSCIRIRFRR